MDDNDSSMWYFRLWANVAFGHCSFPLVWLSKVHTSISFYPYCNKVRKKMNIWAHLHQQVSSPFDAAAQLFWRDRQLVRRHFGFQLRLMLFYAKWKSKIYVNWKFCRRRRWSFNFPSLKIHWFLTHLLFIDEQVIVHRMGLVVTILIIVFN